MKVVLHSRIYINSKTILRFVLVCQVHTYTVITSHHCTSGYHTFPTYSIMAQSVVQDTDRASAYTNCTFMIILNEKHNHKNVFALGRFHSQGINTFNVNRDIYIRNVISEFEFHDDIDYIVVMSTIDDTKYREMIENYFTKNMRFYSIDVVSNAIPFVKPKGWIE